jgi:HK97 family phage portal protein
MGLLSTLRARVGALWSARPVGAGPWLPLTVREPFTGAWQLNQSVTTESALSNPSVFGCVSRISQDIAKIAPPALIEQDDQGFWTPTRNSAYSPVLARPNRYQTPQQFFEQWALSKLLTGNTYVLKDRDERGVVKALYVLDPAKVNALVAPDGSVYYELQADDLAGIATEAPPTVVAATEIMHDRWNCLFHPLVGVSPLYAMTGAIAQAKLIQDSGTAFFAKGGRPGGVLIAPTKLDPATTQRIKADLANLKAGEVLVAELGMKWEPSATTAVDAQVIQQLGWTEETVAKCFGMPISILNSSKQPPYANAEASQLQYKAHCLEPHLVSIQNCLDVGLELPSYLGIEFDIALLIWMDTPTRTAAAREAIHAGAMSPNEARAQYFGLGPVEGGDTPYLQQQNFSLAALAERDAADPFSKTTPAPTAPTTPTEEEVAATVGDLAEKT